MSSGKSTYYIETYGCQMNKYDSELIAGILQKEGYIPAREPESADIVLVNTCSVRESAETRAKGRINALKSYKEMRKDVLIGVVGCMAERLHSEITRAQPFVDFVLGPDKYKALPELINKLQNGGLEREYEAAPSPEETYDEVLPQRVDGVSAWVAIMRGCNNFCSYCIVPYVRGRERSRAAGGILREVNELVDSGFVEVTLLGQNVNSYRDGEVDFADLLGKVAHTDGIYRVRFATSHPKDITQKLIRTIADNDTICSHIHLPVQAGSDRILQLMNRGYTNKSYRDIISRIRETIPRVTITTDIIVGFPGETEQEFQETVKLVDEIQYDAAFIFKYSPRKGTAAARKRETLTDGQKVKRLEKLLRLQKSITLKKNRSLIGVEEEILVEGTSKKSEDEMMGRTDGNKIVVLKKNGLKTGEITRCKIVGAEGFTLFGESVNPTA